MKYIPLSKLHTQLRFTGGLVRTVWPRFSLRRIRLCNKLMGLYRGHARSKSFDYEQIYIERPDSTRLRLCVFTPKLGKEGAVGLLWLHGGGYAIGCPEQDIDFIEPFIRASGCVVIAPDYRLSVDAPYPAALDDAYLALKWVKENCAACHIASDKLFVGGNSAGGGLAAALCLYARDKGEISVAFQMPLYPMLDDRATDSSRQNDAPVWNTASNELAWKLYIGGGEADKYCAPAREVNFSDLPPMLTFIGSAEPFLDETIAYVNSLERAGVKVSFKVFEGCYHAFDMLHAFVPVAREAREFLMSGFIYAAEHYSRAQIS